LGGEVVKVALLVAATGAYDKFISPLLTSMGMYFFKGHDVEPVIFTDSKRINEGRIINCPHRPWPDGTLLRYHYYWQAREIIREYDFVMACDADMRFVGEVGPEIVEELVATQHPGFRDKRGSYEQRRNSTAFVADNESGDYYCGGFIGGKPHFFLQMVQTIVRNIDIDKSNGLIAEWHDESHLNRYLMTHAPTRVLSPAYCTPQGAKWFVPTEPAKLMALDKDHAKLRRF
jgi:histo-blood group ABO system transferase